MFSSEEQEQLLLIGAEPRADNSFIRICVEMLYKDDLHRLSSKCVKKSTKSVKDPMTPEKLTVIRSAMHYRHKRISTSGEEATDLTERFTEATINRKISAALSNITKTLKNRQQRLPKSDLAEIAQTDSFIEHTYVDQNGLTVTEMRMIPE